MTPKHEKHLKGEVGHLDYALPSADRVPKVFANVTAIFAIRIQVSWPATTQPTTQRFGVKLVSKYADWAGFAGYADF
jgi:hypothetical protein